MTDSDGRPSAIDKRDFDANRPLLHNVDMDDEDQGRSRPDSRLSAIPSLNDGTDGLLTNVVDEIVERDRRKMAKEVVRVCSFVLGVISWLELLRFIFAVCV